MITDNDILQATAYINDVDIYTVGALVESFKVSGTAIENTAYQGVNSTNFNVLSTTRGMRVITLNLFYKGTTRRELALKKAKIDNLIGDGKIDLKLPDGFHYAAFLTGTGEEQTLGVEGNEIIALSTYTLQGIRHDDLEAVSTYSSQYGAPYTFQCKSLIPETDCRIQVTIPTAGASGDVVIKDDAGIGSVTMTNVGANAVLLIDGINKRILKNGAPFTGTMSFIKFPKLVPGDNRILLRYGGTDRTKDLMVYYYPTY